MLLLAGGTCAALSAGGGDAPMPRGGDDDETPPPVVAKPGRVRAAADDEGAAPAAEPVAARPPTDADVTPFAPGVATSDGFPPFEHRGGPLLVRRGPDGTSVLDPLGDDVWRPFLPRGDGHLQAVLAPGRVLVATTHCEAGVSAEIHGWPTHLRLAETPRGAAQVLFPDDIISFVATRGSSVIVLETKRRRLLRASVAAGVPGAPVERTELDSLGDVERVVAVASGCAYVTTPGDDRLVRVPFDGSAPRRTELRASERILPSLDGRLVAVLTSMPWRAAADAEGTPSIRVIDAADDRETTRVPHIDIGVSPLSSGVPQLEAAWADDRRLRWSETVDPAGDAGDAGDVTPAELSARRLLDGRQRWVEIDARTGERLADVVYAEKLSLRHEPPPTAPVLVAPGPADRTGRFAIRGDEIFFDGAFDRPAARATWAPGAMSGEFISVSPDGRFAVVCVTDDKRRLVVLLDGETHTRRIVHRGADTPQACGGADTHFSWLAAP